MKNPQVWRTTIAVSGLVIAVPLFVVFDVTVPWVLIFLGVWNIAGATLRVVVERSRAKNAVEESAAVAGAETPEPPSPWKTDAA